MKSWYEKISEAAAYIEQYLEHPYLHGIITGTGIEINVNITHRLAYQDIPHFVTSTVQSHSGELLIGTIGGSPTLILSGRMHYYEGYSAQEITFPVRVLKALGVQKLYITNVSGGLNPAYEAGNVVLLRDHIFLQPEHPLRGTNDDRMGPRFPDMLETYDKNLLAKAKKICSQHHIPYHTGVYACLQGPSLETPAEYNYLRIIGADMVGMSTIPEVIVAKHSGLSIAVLSIISNVCYPIDTLTPTTIESVIEVAHNANPLLNTLIAGMIND